MTPSHKAFLRSSICPTKKPPTCPALGLGIFILFPLLLKSLGAPPLSSQKTPPNSSWIQLCPPRQSMLRIEAALQARFPRQEAADKTCSECGFMKVRKLFSVSQWHKKAPVCLECRPVQEAFQKKLLSGKMCFACEKVVNRDGFSDAQWSRGSASRCRACVASAGHAQAKAVKVCSRCGLEKLKKDFAQTQWEMPKKTGSQCRDCSAQRVQERHKNFCEEIKSKQQLLPSTAQEATGDSPVAEADDSDKAAAHRWLLNAPLHALPSESVRSFQAMHVLRSSKRVRPAPDKSGIPAEEKLKLLTACHVELSHLGGRDAVVQALKEEGKTWTNIALDAQWVVKRCEECRSNSTRDCRKPQPRHLPTPGFAGEVIGFDLKTVKPHTGQKWLMLLAVDFSSKKCFAWDLDFGKGDCANAQAHMLRFFCEQELPLVVWTDNGGPFRNVIQAALEKAIGLKPRHIPPGRPQANGLVEVYNRILDSAHAGDRERLMSAVVAYNNMPQPRFGTSPETVWRVLRPPQSRWRNLQISNMMHGPKPDVTDEEWLHYLSAEENFKKDYYKLATDKYHEALQPVQEAMADKHLRQDMKRTLKYNNKRSHAADAPLLSGDRVIAKNTQYTSKTGHGKFEVKDGQVRQYTVRSVSQGFVQLEDVATGQPVCKHESNLKLMPAILVADDSLNRLPKPSNPIPLFKIYGNFAVIPCKGDGACLYRALNMALSLLGGLLQQTCRMMTKRLKLCDPNSCSTCSFGFEPSPGMRKHPCKSKSRQNWRMTLCGVRSMATNGSGMITLLLPAGLAPTELLPILLALSATKASPLRSTSLTMMTTCAVFGLKLALAMVVPGVVDRSVCCGKATITSC